FGSEKVLFGTDSPWASQSESVKALMSLQLSDDEKSNILSLNAIKLTALSSTKV
ncbi:MAG: amidohydrolase family protein, partial [Synergistaceae bacterium]|nr:amidohydrolase family protein [Synergistaceae bacterium]